MNIGLCGSHRTGKTTLAEAISRKTGLHFVKTETSDVFKKHGLDPSSPIDFEKRLWIQHKILDAAERLWTGETRQFITDRTPLDMAAYTLADIQGSTNVRFGELQEYLDRCFSTTSSIFSVLALIQPGIPLMHEEGKAALNESYLEHLNYLILGLCHDDRVNTRFVFLNRDVMSLEDRTVRILEVIDSVRATKNTRH